MNNRILITAVWSVASLIGPRLLAQPADTFTLAWYAIDAGGGGAVSTGDVFSMTGAVVPADPGPASSGGFSETGGSLGVLGSVSLLSLPPDGTVVYCRYNPNTDSATIWFANLAGGSDTFVTPGWMAHISLDRRYLVFLRNGPNGSAAGSRGDLWVRDLLTGLETKLYANTDYIVSADLTRAADRVYFDFGCADWSLPRDGSANGNAFQLSGGSCYDDAPAINPVDGRVAYHNNGGGGGIGIATTNFLLKSMVPNAGLGTYPLWSHDGQWFSYTLTSGYYTYNGYNLYKIRPDGSSQTQLTFLTGPANRFPMGAAWVPGNTALIGAATINGSNGLYQVAADGSGVISLLNLTQAGDPVAYVGAVMGNPPPPPRLGASIYAGNLTLTWSDPNFFIESAPTLTGPWTQWREVGSPFVATPQGGQGFFRLQQR